MPLLVSVALGAAGVFTLLSTASAGDNIWTTTGPYGVRIMGIVIDPTDSQTIYATTPDGPTSVFKSLDGGMTWAASSAGIPAFAEAGWSNSIVLEPGNPDTLYVATRKGVYKSTDGAATWTQKSTLLEDGAEYLIEPFSIAISPVDGILFAGGGSRSMGGNGAGQGIFRSTDGGETWERLANGAPDDESDNIRYLVVAPSAPHIVYAGGDAALGIYKSTDWGDSWTAINSGFVQIPDMSNIAVDPYDAQVVYLSALGDGIYKTTDGGEHWTPIGSGLGNSDIRAMVIDPSNQQTIFAGGGPDTGGAGVYRSLDNFGLSWAPMMEGMGSRAVWSFAIDQNNPQNIYAGTNSGIWKYTFVSGSVDYSISVNDGALFTNQTAVTLTMTAPAGTTEMIISNDGGFGGAVWEPFAAQKPWTITSAGNHVIPRLVYIKFKTGGQTSGLYQDDIVLDITGPTGNITALSPLPLSANPQNDLVGTMIEAPANPISSTVYLPVMSKNARPGYTLVELALSAVDDVSGVRSMILSNDPAFAGANWEPYTTARLWWQPLTGNQTIYVKFRDRAGNESPIYSDTPTP